jgi:hypothetical protein
MPNVVSDIILSPAKVYHAAVGATPPADTVAAGTAWGGGWTNIGFTEENVKLNYEFEEKESRPQQSLGPVRRWKTSEDLTIETKLAELYLDGINMGANGTVSQTAAGAGQPGKEELVVGGTNTLTERAWGFEGQYIDEDGATFPVRFIIWKATAKLGGEMELDKEEITGVPLEINALADLTKTAGQQLFKVIKILEPAT